MRRASALPFLLVTVFLDILGLGIVVPVAPALVAALGGHTRSAVALFGLLGASFGGCQAVAAPLLGGLSDRYGRRPVLVVALAALGLDYLVHATAPVLWLLFVAHGMAGALAGTWLVVPAYVADVTAPERRPRAYGLVGAAAMLGFVAGPVLGGLLGTVSLRLPFWCAGVLCLVNAAYGVLVLPEPGRRRATAALTGPLTALARFHRRPGFRALVGYRCCADVARLGLPQVWVLYTMHRYGWSTAAAGLALAVSGVAGAAVQARLAGPSLARCGARRGLVRATLVWATAVAGYALAPAGWLMYPLLLAERVGGVAEAGYQTWAAGLAGDDERGLLQGALTAVGAVTSTVVPVGATVLYAWTAPALVLLAMAAFLGLAAWIAARAAAPGAPVRPNRATMRD